MTRDARHAIRVLIADDNPLHRELLTTGLRGHRPEPQVRTVATGDELRVALAAERFDCVVLDFHLGDVEAYELIRACEHDLDDCPVVVTSADASQEVAVASFRCKPVVDFVPKADAFTDELLWRRMKRAIARHRKRAADRRRAERRERCLLRIAETDPLTGLANRRYLDRCFAADRWRNERRGPVAVFLFDVDRFKRINDTHGHAAGDRTLEAIAHATRELCGPADIVARWGGEEFLIIRTSVDADEARAFAETLRQRIAGLKVSHDGVVIEPTVSIGVTSTAPERFGLDTIEEADRAMYRAKEAGRNRVCAGPLVDAGYERFGRFAA